MPQLELKYIIIPHEGVEPMPPTRATEGSAGMDLRAAIAQPVEIAPRALVRIPTGVAVALPSKEWAGLVFARSGLAVKHGIALSNGVGLIDSDYRGELIAGLCNLSDTTYTIQPGERIAQLVVAPVATAALVAVDTLDASERGAGGFGSTGRF